MSHFGILNPIINMTQFKACKSPKMRHFLKRTLSVTMCGCNRLRNKAETSIRQLPTEAQNIYIKNVVPRVHQNCHFEK